MQIVVNKDLSIYKVDPENVYQGSANADFLSVFAPFSIRNYTSVLLYIELPSGKLLEPRAAFAATVTEDGVGVWSMPIDAEMTETAGEVKCQLAFIGTDSVNTTDTFTITVGLGVAPFPPSTPSYDVYQQILAYLSALAGGGASGGGGGGVPVVIVQTTGTSTTAVMSQKAVTDEIDALKRKDVLQDQAIKDIRVSGSSFPTYNSTGRRTLVFYKLDGSGSLEVPLDQGGGGGGGASDPTVYMLSDSNPNFIIHDQGDGIYKARVLIYTAVPVCASSLEDYYYCTNMLTVLLENGMTLNKVCISNNLLHSNGSIYNNGIHKYHWDIDLPLPLGDEMTFGYNDTGYYLRPNLMSGSPHVSTYWSSDWYVEMELDVNQGLLIIKAYQCKRITGIS